MSCVIDYRVRINKEKQRVELVKWDGEEQVIAKIHFHEKAGFTLEEAKQQVMKCITAIKSTNSK